MFDELVKKKEKEKGVSERTNSTMAEIDDGPNGACTLHKGSTTNVNFESRTESPMTKSSRT